MELSNDRILVGFNELTGGINRITHLASGNQFIANSVEKPLCWRLVFQDDHRNQLSINNIEQTPPVFNLQSQVLTIEWKDVILHGTSDSIDIKAICDISDEQLKMNLNVENHSKSLGIWNVDFPIISSLSEKGYSDIAIGKGNWGQLFKNANEPITGEYPSYTMPMQFMLLNEGISGLYLAAHDQGAMHKTFTLDPGNEFRLSCFPPDMGVPGAGWESSYPFAIGVYDGDWMTGCKMYREWAISSTHWTSKGPIAYRADLPESMRNVAAWIIGRRDKDEASSTGIRFAQAVGAPVGVHWYEWHEITFDRDYPSYFPTKPGMDEGAAKMKEYGIIAMPYVNCRLWDTQEKNYKTAIPYTVKDQDGNPVVEDYGSGTTLAVMCPTQRFWHDKLFGIIERLIEEVGVNAIYLDQIASAPPRQCFDISHGHPIGSGTWWVDGYREMLNRIKDYCTKNGRSVGLTSENNAEPYIDNIDSFLIWTPREQNEIPMITAVYSGYALYFASNRAFTYGFYGKSHPGYGDESFCMLQARDFVWGSQLGWEEKLLLELEHAAKLEFQTRLARIRSQMTAYMSDGELVNILETSSPIPDIHGTWNTWSGDQPVSIKAVHGALWRGVDGTYAAIFANADTQAHIFTYSIDINELGLHSLHAILDTPSPRFDLTIEDSILTQTVEIPGRDGIVIRYRP